MKISPDHAALNGHPYIVSKITTSPAPYEALKGLASSGCHTQPRASLALGVTFPQIIHPAANISTTAVLRCTCSHFILNFEFFILNCAVTTAPRSPPRSTAPARRSCSPTAPDNKTSSPNSPGLQ